MDNENILEDFQGIKVPWYIRFIHVQLKNSTIIALKSIVATIPKSKRRDNYNKLTSGELQRQWLALERGLDRWNKQHKCNSHLAIDNNGRSNTAITLFATIYFTILSHDGNWCTIVSTIIDEYKKIRKW